LMPKAGSEIAVGIHKLDEDPIVYPEGPTLGNIDCNSFPL